MKSHGNVVSLLAAVALLGGCQPATPQFTAQDEAAIRAVFDGVVSDLRGGSLDAWAARFTEDARFYAPNGPVLAGRAAILAWGKAMPPIASFSFADVAISGEGNLAYGSSRVFLQMRGIPADTSKQLVVLRRDAAGHWLVQAVAISSDLPLPAPKAPATKRR